MVFARTFVWNMSALSADARVLCAQYVTSSSLMPIAHCKDIHRSPKLAAGIRGMITSLMVFHNRGNALVDYDEVGYHCIILLLLR